MGIAKPIPLGFCVNCCVNANYFTFNVKQGSAGVTAVNGGIDLHQVLYRFASAVRTDNLDFPSFSAQHTYRYRMVKLSAVGVADGDHPFTLARFVRIS